jgi:hypothetical protein
MASRRSRQPGVLERKPDIAAGKYSFVVPNPTRGASRQRADRRAVREGERSLRSPGAPRARREAALAWRALRWQSSAGGHDWLDLRSPTGISPKAARYVFYDYGNVAISEFNARDLRGPGELLFLVA